MPDDPQPTREVGVSAHEPRFLAGVERVDQTTGPVAALVASPTTAAPETRSAHGRKPRVRKVRGMLRHVDARSVLKISLLFYFALFLIICVASAVLWAGARASGRIDNLESFITSVGGFGTCEPIPGAAPLTSTTQPGAISTAPPDGAATSAPDLGATGPVGTTDGADCRPGEQLVGEFTFDGARVFEAFALGGAVLVVAGTAANVVMVLLFNLMSELTGGVRVTVLEEEPAPRAPTVTGSPRRRRRG